MVSFLIWICYLHWKSRSIMMDSSSYYSEPIVPQENKKLTGPKTQEKSCENGSTIYVEKPEIKEGNSAFLFKKPSPSPDNELIIPDVLDIESEEKVVLTPLSLIHSTIQKLKMIFLNPSQLAHMIHIHRIFQ